MTERHSERASWLVLLVFPVPGPRRQGQGRGHPGGPGLDRRSRWAGRRRGGGPVPRPPRSPRPARQAISGPEDEQGRPADLQRTGAGGRLAAAAAGRGPQSADPAGSAGRTGLFAGAGHGEILEVPTGEVDRSQGDIHPLGNPHYLLDPRTGHGGRPPDGRTAGAARSRAAATVTGNGPSELATVMETRLDGLAETGWMQLATARRSSSTTSSGSTWPTGWGWTSSGSSKTGRASRRRPATSRG